MYQLHFDGSLQRYPHGHPSRGLQNLLSPCKVMPNQSLAPSKLVPTVNLLKSVPLLQQKCLQP